MNELISVRTEGVDELFADLARLTGKPPGRMIRERAGMLGRYFASATQPVADAEASANASAVASFASGFATTVGVAISGTSTGFSGDSKFARELGRAAVQRDVNRVYLAPTSTFKYIRDEFGMQQARAFYKLLKEGALTAASELLKKLGIAAGNLEVIGWDDGERHGKRRNRRGRISKSTVPAIVPNAQPLRAYIRTVMKRVGWAKSGWISAAKQIPNAKGMSGVPQWMKQPAPGRGIDRTQGDDPFIILYNDVGYIEGLIPQRYISGAQANFEESLAKEVEKVTEFLRRKHGAR